jgi:hypothetical protein
MVKHAHHAQGTVDPATRLLQLHFVVMGLVALEKIVSHVHQIALEPIHVSIALPQTGKHPLGWNVVHHVEIRQHGFQNMVKVVVAHYKISQCPLHIIMVLTFHHVHVPLLDPIVEMVHVMEPKRVELALEIVEHVHLRLEQELKHLLEHHPIHPLAQGLQQELALEPLPILLLGQERHPILEQTHQPIHLLKHLLGQGRHPILEQKRRLEHKHHQIRPHKHQLLHRHPVPPPQKHIHQLHLQHHQVRQHQKRLHLPTQHCLEPPHLLPLLLQQLLLLRRLHPHQVVSQL